MRIQKQEIISRDQIEEEKLESSDSWGECYKKKIIIMIVNCEIKSNITNSSALIINEDNCTGRTFMKIFNVAKSVINQIKSKLE